MLIDCGTPAQTYSFTIPAGAPADTVTGLIDEIEAGSTCTVTETADGSSSTISVVAVGGGQQATISAAGVSQADLTDTFSDVVVPTTEHHDHALRRPPTAAHRRADHRAANHVSGTLPATGGGTNMLWPGCCSSGRAAPSWSSPVAAPPPDLGADRHSDVRNQSMRPRFVAAANDYSRDL